MFEIIAAAYYTRGDCNVYVAEKEMHADNVEMIAIIEIYIMCVSIYLI
jgi:hypothetical protein